MALNGKCLAVRGHLVVQISVTLEPKAALAHWPC
jgi:hypothetical protein